MSQMSTTEQMATWPQQYQQGLFYRPREYRQQNKVEEFRATSVPLLDVDGRNTIYALGNGGLYSKQVDRAKVELSNFKSKFNQWKKTYDKEIGKTKADLANLTPRLMGLGLASKIHNLSSVTSSRLSTPSPTIPPGCATPMSNYSTPSSMPSSYNTPCSTTPTSVTPIPKSESSSSLHSLKRSGSNCSIEFVTPKANSLND